MTLKDMTPKFLKETMLDFPLYIISRPFKGFDEMKYLNRGKLFYSIAILIIYAFVVTWSIQSVGFVITGFDYGDAPVYVFWIMLFNFAPILLICVANWSITSITDGKGRFKDIFMVYTYALFPTIFCLIAGTVLSNFVTLNEVAFVRFFFVFANFTLYAYLFVGLVVVHEFTFFKGILMVLLTVLSMMIIVFVLALFISLVSELLNFIFTIAYEAEAHLL